MESDDQYFHLPPELRQLMLFSSKQPIFPGAASGHLYSLSPQLPSPPPPHAPPISAGDGGICSSQSRWPRQETLTLLEIRARLDPQFREVGQKAPLWDEVARIMAEEYGYRRSGRKCREKLDNLYKYYKKTKEGKIGKQEGKHYRFFRQLEALYGPSAATATATAGAIRSPNPTNAKKLNLLENLNALMFSTSSESSGEEEPAAAERNSYSETKSWVAELVEAQMKRLLEMQEAWFERMMMSFERMEQERLRREEGWRREEAARQERERRRLASERAWAEAREASLITALEKIIQQRENMGSAMVGGEESAEMECDLSRVMGVL